MTMNFGFLPYCEISYSLFPMSILTQLKDHGCLSLWLGDSSFFQNRCEVLEVSKKNILKWPLSFSSPLQSPSISKVRIAGIGRTALSKGLSKSLEVNTRNSSSRYKPNFPLSG